jgi:hypothetical protein
VRVERYRFGTITIGGTSYGRDLIVTPRGVVSDWRRRHGHRLVFDDLGAVDLEGVQRMVVGTGYFGRMTVDQGVQRHFEARGIPFTVANSRRAVEAFNEAGEGAALAIHLTC